MGFYQLPDELLIDIIKYVAIHDSKHSLSSLARCCRKFNPIATPMLYQSFTETSFSSVPKFLRTVLHNPQLGSYVRIYTGYGIEDEEALDISEFTEDDFQACRAAMKKLGNDPDTINSWMCNIQEYKEWHAITGLLLLHLPNIESVDIYNYRPDNSGDLGHALGIAARLQACVLPGSRYSLQKLTNVLLCPYETKDDADDYTEESFMLSPSDMVHFCKLKSVKSVVVYRAGLQGAESLPEIAQNLSTKELLFIDSFLDPFEIEIFLPHFTSIRKLTYQHGPKPDFLPQSVGRAIQHLKPCLEELDISDVTEENGTYEDPEHIGSFAEFEKLKSITMEFCALFGFPSHYDDSYPAVRLAQILPRSLETLTVVGVGDDMPCRDENLRELLMAKDERFPNLKKISMKGIKSCLADPVGLKSDFKSKGVKLVM